MIDTYKDINQIAGNLIVAYKGNPMISEDMFRAYQHGIISMRDKVCEYLKNKTVLSGGEIVDMLESLSYSIDDMSNDRITDAYNKGIEDAQDIVYKYVR